MPKKQKSRKGEARQENFRKSCKEKLESAGHKLPEIIPPRKGPGGRPSTYKTEYCDTIIELGAQGKDLTQIAREMKTTRKTLYEWAKKYPEFGDAMECARDYRLAWWHDVAQVGVLSPANMKFSDRYMTFILKNGDSENYKDTVVQQTEGSIKVEEEKNVTVKVEATDQIRDMLNTLALNKSASPENGLIS